MKRFDFAHLVPGSESAGAACVRAREPRQTKVGKPYLVVELGNGSGQASARVWSEGLDAWEHIRAGDAVDLRARVQAGWRGGAPELVILSVSKLPEDHPVRLELNPRSPVAFERLEERFEGLTATINRPEALHLLELVLEYVGREKFMTAPAAVSNHHNYIHGLLEHSVEVAEMAVALASTERYADRIDRDMLIAAALAHDIGKVEAYDWEGVPIRISRSGRLRSHVCRGAEMVGTAVSVTWAIEGNRVAPRDVDLLKHIIESHHGTLEWGSPTPPRTLEAVLVHHADVASARLAEMSDDLGSAPAHSDHWVDPIGWRRGPVWDFACAYSFQAAPNSKQEENAVHEFPARDAANPLDGETRAYMLTKGGGDHD